MNSSKVNLIENHVKNSSNTIRLRWFQFVELGTDYTFILHILNTFQTYLPHFGVQ